LLEAALKPVRNLDWRTLMMLSQHGWDPKTMIALGFQELATNAQKIGELSPDLLNSLVAFQRDSTCRYTGGIGTSSTPIHGREGRLPLHDESRKDS
jgi:hypothetical protein